MSIGSEMLQEMLIDILIAEDEAERDYIRLKAAAESGYWVTREGETINISNMKGSHIRNAIKMIERNCQAEIYSDVEKEIALISLSLMKKELEKRYPPLDPLFIWE